MPLRHCLCCWIGMNYSPDGFRLEAFKLSPLPGYKQDQPSHAQQAGHHEGAKQHHVAVIPGEGASVVGGNPEVVIAICSAVGV